MTCRSPLMGKKVFHLLYPLNLRLLSNIKIRLSMQSSFTSSDKLTVSSCNFTLVPKKVLLHCYAWSLSGTTTADLYPAKTLHPKFLQQTTLCLKKICIASSTPQFPSHLLTLYLGYNQQQIAITENISREGEQDSLGREKRYPTLMYIFC